MLYLKICFGLLFLITLAQFLGLMITKGRSIHIDTISNFAFTQQLGSIFLVTIYAITITQFKTIFICTIPILIYFARYYRTKAINIKFDKNEIFTFIFYFLIASVFAFIIIRGIEFDDLKVPIKDQASYAMIVKGLNQHQVENYAITLFPLEEISKASPYHYFEIWMAAIISKILGYNEILSLTGVSTAFILFNLFCAVYSWFRNYKFPIWNKYLAISASILFPLIRGFLHYFSNDEYYWDSIFFDGSLKFIFLIPFFISVLKLQYLERGREAILLLMLLPILNTILLPTILLSIIIYIFIHLIFRISLPSGIFKIDYIITVICFIILLALYTIIISSGEGVDVIKSIGGIVYNILNNAKKWFLINSLLLISTCYLVFKLKEKISVSSLILIFSLIFSGLIVRAIFDTTQNSFQLFTSISFLSVYGLTLINFQGFSSLNKRVALYTFSVYFILVSIMFSENYKSIKHLFIQQISAYSLDYTKEISKIKLTNPIGIRFVNSKSRSNLMKNPSYVGLSDYFPLTENMDATVVMNVNVLFPESIDQSHHANSLRKEFKNSSFFIKSMKYDPITHDSIDLHSRIQLYITTFKPEFCIVEPEAIIPEYLNKYILQTITDSNSGEKILLLSTK